MLFDWLAHLPRQARGPAARRPIRLAVESLEERAVPAASVVGPFVLDRVGALYAATTTAGGLINTGGFGKSLSAGTDLAGDPMAVIRDFNSRVYIYDQGTWIDTGGWAREVVAGVHGEFFARDFNNLVYRYQLGAGWSIATSPGTGDSVGHLAIQMSLGQQTVNGAVENVLYSRDPDDRIEVYRDAGSTDGAGNFAATFVDTGGFGTDVAAGYEGEGFVRDMNSQLYVNHADGSWTATGAWAYSLDVGRGANGDFLAFTDFNNLVYLYNPDDGTFVSTAGYGQQVAAGSGVVFIRDFNDDVHYFDVDAHTWTDTGHAATLIRVANRATLSTPSDQAASPLLQLWGIDGDPGNAGHVFVAGGGWIALRTFATDIH